MRFLIYGDVHFSTYSSIIRSKGEKYSKRLENLINSINWAEELAIKNNCDEIISLGDFFDKPDLNSEELTALTEIKWAKLPHTLIVGNHESPYKALRYNSVNALYNLGFNIISEVSFKNIDNCSILYLPYILEEDRKNLLEYMSLNNNLKENKIVFSHNDIKGQFGQFVSKEGFGIEDIESNCSLFLNGHLHNGNSFCKNGINLGNLTGQNFGEDAFRYSHNVYILDTDTNKLTSYENPYGFNFYQLDFKLNSKFLELNNLKNNAIVSLKCYRSDLDNLRLALESYPNILESRIIVKKEYSDELEEITLEKFNSIDYLNQFKVFVQSKLGVNAVIEDELNKIIK